MNTLPGEAMDLIATPRLYNVNDFLYNETPEKASGAYIAQLVE
jgi:hypothetical protein